jgi:hypothetical protein
VSSYHRVAASFSLSPFALLSDLFALALEGFVSLVRAFENRCELSVVANPCESFSTKGRS